MDYTQKKKAKEVYTGKAVYTAEHYENVKKDEFLADLGSDPQDIYDNLTFSCGEYVGYYLPKFLYCPSEYLSGVALGRQPCLLINEKANVTRPGNKFFGFKYLREEIKQYKEVLSYLPKRFHRTGLKKDTLILEDIDFVFTVFASVKPNEFKVWYDIQSQLHKADLEDNNPKNVRVPSYLLKKLKLMEKRNYRKGKTGPMILNRDKKENNKRKRENDVYETVKKNEVDDKVWMPPAHLQEGYKPAVDQTYVNSNEYTTLNDKFRELERLSARYINCSIKTPWILAMTYPDPTHRLNAYNSSAEALRKSLAETRVVVPTYEEAVKEWGNSN